MKRKLYVLLLGLCMVSMSACGKKEESDNSDNIRTSSHIEEPIAQATGDEVMKENISIEDIAWNVDEGIVDGERYVLLNYTNNTPYTIAGFEIVFKERTDITEEEKLTFYSDIQKMFEASDEEIEEIKGYPISMHAKTERVIDTGESVTNVNCLYYTGYYYLKDINHYNLVQPDIATIKYVDEDKIYTVYYDYNSKKYSSEAETEVAYQWSRTNLGSKIPKPEVKIVDSSMDTEETFSFDAYGMSLEQFNAYVEECKVSGYTVDPSDYEGFYSADDADGYNIYLHYGEDDHVISGIIKAPSGDTEEIVDEEENNSLVSEDEKNEGVNKNEELVDGMRPEFKEALDSYEEFYDEYCDILKKYTENPSDMQLLADYTDMMQKGAEMTEKFEAWEDSDLNEAELKYYLDVNNRVTQKLLEVYE